MPSMEQSGSACTAASWPKTLCSISVDLAALWKGRSLTRDTNIASSVTRESQRQLILDILDLDKSLSVTRLRYGIMGICQRTALRRHIEIRDGRALTVTSIPIPEASSIPSAYFLVFSPV